MVQLWKRGRELMAQGRDDVWGDHSDTQDPHWEFVRIDKRLYQLLHRDLHQVSVFDRALFDGDFKPLPMPAYVQARWSVAHPDFNGWRSAQETAKALDAALQARRNGR